MQDPDRGNNYLDTVCVLLDSDEPPQRVPEFRVAKSWKPREMDSFSRGSQRLRPPTGRWVLKGNGPQDSHLGLGSIPVYCLGSIPVALRECAKTTIVAMTDSVSYGSRTKNPYLKCSVHASKSRHSGALHIVIIVAVCALCRRYFVRNCITSGSEYSDSLVERTRAAR